MGVREPREPELPDLGVFFVQGSLPGCFSVQFDEIGVPVCEGGRQRIEVKDGGKGIGVQD